MTPFSEEMRRNPFPFYEQLRASGPLFHFPPLDMWFVLDYDGVKRVLTDHEAFSSEIEPPGGKAPDWLIFSDPPLHEKRRSLIMRAFTPRSVAALEPRIAAISRQLLDGKMGTTIDLVADYAWPLPTLVIAELMGLPAVDAPLIMRWGEAIMGLSYSVVGGEAAQQKIATFTRVMVEMQAYMVPLFEERRRAPQEDLVTRLVQAEIDGERLSLEELLGFCQLLLAAGTETTTNLVASAMLCLHEFPDERARLLQSPSLLSSAVEEVARFRSPGQMMFRKARRDVELAGHTIPAGRMVLAVIGAANRDPGVFPQPQRFDVGRTPNAHLGFGHGIHFCIGAALGRLETRLALADLLPRGPVLQEGEAWTPRPAVFVYGPERLSVRLTGAA
jgi:cytochrome P450